MNINLVQICGRMTKDVELRNLPSGSAVASFSVATNRKWKKDDQEHEETEFHNVVAFGRTAEVISQYIHKGDEIYIIGRLKTSSWEDKDTGKKMYKTDVVADRFEFGQKSKANQGNSQPKEEPVETIDVKDIGMDDVPY